MKILSFLLILISGIFLISCGPTKEVCLINGPIHTNEDDGVRFIAQSLLSQLKIGVLEKKKTLYINDIRYHENGKIMKFTEKFSSQLTDIFHQSNNFSILQQKVGEKQANYIIQGTLFLENLPHCFLGGHSEEGDFVLRVRVINSENREVKATAHAVFSSFDTTPTSLHKNPTISPKGSKSAIEEAKTSQLTLGDFVSSDYMSTLTISQLLDEGNAFRAEGSLEKANKSYDKAKQKVLIKGTKREDIVQVCEVNYQTNYLLFEQTEDEINKELHLEEASQCLTNQLIAQIDYAGKVDAPIAFKTDTTDVVEKHKNRLLTKAMANYLAETLPGAKEPPCIMIVGHTSCTGTVEYNCKLSRERSKVVEKRIIDAYPGNKMRVKKRLASRGRAFFEAIDGRHDDTKVVDDRRVEFRIVSCEKLASANLPTCENFYEQEVKPKSKWDKCKPSKL